MLRLLLPYLCGKLTVMIEKDIIYWLWISLVYGPASTKINLLYSKFGNNAEAIYNEAPNLPPELIPSRSAAKLSDKSLDECRRIFEYCENNNIDIITPANIKYPEKLKNIPSMPAVLYSQGYFPDFDKEFSIASVGSRKISEYGKRNAYTISYDLAKTGAIIVSGMARGIDSISHEAAIDAGGITVAVTGCGIDKCYPPENEGLRENICANGCVITEYSPGTPPVSYNFPQRNRLISGLSNATVVIEAAYKSGALITAELAVKQGRPVYALPGNVGAEFSAGTNDLIMTGAKIITSAESLLKDFDTVSYNLKVENLTSYKSSELSPVPKKRNISPPPEYIKQKIMKDNSDNNRNVELKAEVKDFHPQSENERKVYEIISKEPSSPDKICEKSGLSIADVMTTLTLLELDGNARAIEGGLYTI